MDANIKEIIELLVKAITLFLELLIIERIRINGKRLNQNTDLIIENRTQDKMTCKCLDETKAIITETKALVKEIKQLLTNHASL